MNAASPVHSIKDADRIFAAEAKKVTSSPSLAQKKATVTRIVNDAKHPPRSLAGKRALLIRIGKYLKKPAYRALLVSSLALSGLITERGFNMFKTGKDPILRGIARVSNAWPFGGQQSLQELDIAYYTGAITMMVGGLLGWHNLKMLKQTFE
jgi:hypothetical protein